MHSVGRAALHRQAYNGLAKCIKDDMVHHEKPTRFPASGNSSKLSMLDTGNDTVKYPTKLVLPEPLETRPNKSLTLASLTTSLAKVLHIPSRRTTTRALPRARVPLPNRRNPPLPTFPQNSEKMES